MSRLKQDAMADGRLVPDRCEMCNEIVTEPGELCRWCADQKDKDRMDELRREEASGGVPHGR